MFEMVFASNEAIQKPLKKLAALLDHLHICYEAGPTPLTTPLECRKLEQLGSARNHFYRFRDITDARLGWARWPKVLRII